MKLEYYLYIIVFVFLTNCCNIETILEKGKKNYLYILYEQQLEHNDFVKSKKINGETNINDGTYTDYWLLKLLSNNRSFALRNNNTISNIENGVFYSLDFYTAANSYSVIWNESFVIYFKNSNELNKVKILNKNDVTVKDILEPIQLKITQNKSLPMIRENDNIVTGGGIYIGSIINISNYKVSNVETKFWNNNNASWNTN